MERTKILFGNENNRAEAAAANSSSKPNKASRASNNAPGQSAHTSANYNNNNQNESCKQLLDILKPSGNSNASLTISRHDLINSLKSCSKSDLQAVIGFVSQEIGTSTDTAGAGASSTLTYNPSSSASLTSLASQSKPEQQQSSSTARLDSNSFDNKSLNANRNSGKYSCFTLRLHI